MTSREQGDEGRAEVEEDICCHDISTSEIGNRVTIRLIGLVSSGLRARGRM